MKYVEFRCPHKRDWYGKSHGDMKCGMIIGGVAVENVEKGLNGDWMGICEYHGFYNIKFGNGNLTITEMKKGNRIDFVNITKLWPLFEVRHE